jgi:hypothetical protein
MEVSCRLVTIEKDDEVYKIAKGIYLEVSCNHPNSKKGLIPYNIFEEVFSIRQNISVTPEIGQLNDQLQGISQPLNVTANLPRQDALDLVLQQIGLYKYTVKDSDLIIKSNFSPFFELAWESIITENLCVYRKTIHKKFNKNTDGVANSIGILMSHSFKDVGRDLKEYMDQEVQSIISILLTNNTSKFRTENIMLVKHTNVQTILDVLEKKLTMLHLIMHGDENGNLCLENSDRSKYKIVEKLPSDKFVEMIRGNGYNLIFLSMCNSGGAQKNLEDNLAYKIIKNAGSSYVVSFIGPVGEKSAKEFSEEFYGLLVNGESIEAIYKEALVKYKVKTNRNKYIPVLYSHA